MIPFSFLSDKSHLNSGITYWREHLAEGLAPAFGLTDL